MKANVYSFNGKQTFFGKKFDQKNFMVVKK